MSLVIFQINNVPQSIKGKLLRFLIEVSPGVFAGKLPISHIKIIWEQITKLDCEAICIVPDKTEIGFKMDFHGKNQTTVSDNFGFNLVKYHKKKHSKTALK